MSAQDDVKAVRIVQVRTRIERLQREIAERQAELAEAVNNLLSLTS